MDWFRHVVSPMLPIILVAWVPIAAGDAPHAQEPAASGTAAPAADTLPQLSTHLVSVRCLQDYSHQTEAGRVGRMVMSRGAWGVEQPGIDITLGVSVEEGWLVMEPPVLTSATARLDSGENLEAPAAASGRPLPVSSTNNVLWNDQIPGGEETVAIHLPAAHKNANRVVSLAASLKVLLVRLSHIKRVTITPVVGTPQPIPDLPGCDLTFSLAPDGKLTLSATTGGLRTVHHLTYLGADGKPLQRRGSSGQTSNTSQTVELTFDRPVGTVQVDVIDTAHAASIDLALIDVPLVGRADDATLAMHPATAEHELPAPDLRAAPAAPNPFAGPAPLGGPIIAPVVPAKPPAKAPVSNF